jgi:hypothetical protein
MCSSCLLARQTAFSQTRVSLSPFTHRIEWGLKSGLIRAGVWLPACVGWYVLVDVEGHVSPTTHRGTQHLPAHTHNQAQEHTQRMPRYATRLCCSPACGGVSDLLEATVKCKGWQSSACSSNRPCTHTGTQNQTHPSPHAPLTHCCLSTLSQPVTEHFTWAMLMAVCTLSLPKSLVRSGPHSARSCKRPPSWYTYIDTTRGLRLWPYFFLSTSERERIALAMLPTSRQCPHLHLPSQRPQHSGRQLHVALMHTLPSGHPSKTPAPCAHVRWV